MFAIIVQGSMSEHSLTLNSIAIDRAAIVPHTVPSEVNLVFGSFVLVLDAPAGGGQDSAVRGLGQFHEGSVVGDNES